jgi:short-subunit dehydrogenase
MEARPLAVVTGASSGIGYELARCCAAAGYDLVIAADEPEIEAAAADLRALGSRVEAYQLDLASPDGVIELHARLAERPVAALLANAGRGLGGAFLDQELPDVLSVIHTNVSGTVHLIQRIGRGMRARGAGRILITGSLLGLLPGTVQAVYAGTKAFLDAFAIALRAELAGSGVTVTCLMPSVLEAQFFERIDLLAAKLGAGKKQSAAEVAKLGFVAMQKGDSDAVAGWQNEQRAAVAQMPSDVRAEQHRKLAAPGTASKA